MIPYGRQQVTQQDIDAVVQVLRGDFLTQGPAVPAFEDAVRSHAGAAHAVAVCNATAALHIACMALELRPGDRLWTVPNTFVASANCARYCGAEADFVDIDPRTWNMSTVALREKLDRARRDGTLPKILVPVHFAGQPTAQAEIAELGAEYGFRIIEDASHAIGASRAGEPVGSCRWSDIVIFSFHPVKIVTSGEGGMALTNDAELAERMRLARTHGITRDPARFSEPGHPDAAFYYEQQTLGYNYRLTDLQAALGRSQVARLSDYVDRRNALAARYGHALAGLPLQRPAVDPGSKSAFHLYVVQVLQEEAGRSRLQIFEELRGRGIGASVHYLPVHLQPYYRARGFAPGMFPVAEHHGASSISLPLYPTLTEQEQDRVVDAVRASLAA